MIKHWLLSVLFIAALMIPISGQAQSSQELFNHSILQWSKELSSQDPRFAPFADTAFDQQALSANSEQWLITFHSKGKIVGYMIVGKQDQDLALLEYGLGPSPLFDPAMVAPFLPTKNEVLKPYYSGLESVWVSDQGIYDAKSGERYPEQIAGHEHERVISSVGKDSKLQTTFHKKPGECICWIKPEGRIESQTDFTEQLQTYDITLLADLFDSTVKAPYQILGYHIWNGEVFIELGDYGSRYIPYTYATSVGILVK